MEKKKRGRQACKILLLDFLAVCRCYSGEAILENLVTVKDIILRASKLKKNGGGVQVVCERI